MIIRDVVDCLNLIHPFSPSVISYPEDAVARYQDYGIIEALRRFERNGDWKCRVHYISGKRHSYSLDYRGLCYHFHPRSFYMGRFDPTKNSGNYFLREWSWSLLRYVIFHRATANIFFTTAGYFTIAMALVSHLQRVPYLLIAGGRGGVPQSRAHRWLLNNCARILIHTEFQRQAWHERFGIPLAKMTVFPMGVDLEQFRPKEKYNYDDIYERGPRLLFVGRIVAGKNLLAVLEALAKIRHRFPNVRLTVVGPWGDNDYRQQVESFVAAHSLTEYVTFTGLVPNTELASYYQCSDLMLFPTTSESFGIVIVESMACGTPVISLRGSGGPDEIIDHNINGLLVSNSEFVDATIGVLCDQARLTQMSVAARQKVEREYSADRTYEQLRSILEQVLTS